MYAVILRFLLLGIAIFLIAAIVAWYIQRYRRRRRERAGRPLDDLVPFREFRWQDKEGTFKVYIDKGNLYAVGILYDHATIEFKDGNIPLREFLEQGSPWPVPRKIENALKQHIAKHIL